jgi:1-deoxy-D-xylulose-5-phosphate synthase
MASFDERASSSISIGASGLSFAGSASRKSLILRGERGTGNGERGTGTGNGLPIAIWATGDWYGKACEVASRVGGIAVHARYLKPFDIELLAKQRAAGMKIVSIENGAVAGGFGEAIGADVKFGWPDAFIPHGTQAELERKYGLDVESIVASLR